MKILRKKEGFTLVEVIVTILLIAVVSTILLYLFTDSFKNIVHSGQKDEAITRNSDILDIIYSLEEPDSESEYDSFSINYIKNELTKYIDDLEYVSDCSNLSNNPNNVKSRYCIETIDNADGTVGYNIKTITFYLNGERSVTHTSFIRKKG